MSENEILRPRLDKAALRLVIDMPVPNTRTYTRREEIIEFGSVGMRNRFIEKLNLLMEEYKGVKGFRM